MHIELYLSFFVFYNTNICISYIINESPTTFLLVQIFEVTIKNKSNCFVTLIFIRSDWTCTYVDWIIYSSYNTGHTPGFSFYSVYLNHLQYTSHTCGIFYPRYILSFTLLGGYCPYNPSFYVFSNPRGRINNRILKTWPHRQMTFSLTKCWPRKINKSSWFYFFPKLSLAIFLSLSQNFCIGSQPDVYLIPLCKKFFGFTPISSSSRYLYLFILFIYPL